MATQETPLCREIQMKVLAATLVAASVMRGCASNHDIQTVEVDRHHYVTNSMYSVSDGKYTVSIEDGAWQGSRMSEVKYESQQERSSRKN